MPQTRTDSTDTGLHTRWRVQLIGLVAILAMVNFVVDSAINAPLVVLPEILDHFSVSATAAAATAIGVRCVVPESLIEATGKIGVGGTVLLGGGLAGMLSCISLGPDLDWRAVGPVALLTCGIKTPARWYLVSSRKPDPLIDVRHRAGPLALTLLVVLL